jgi:BirA family biotin operon repressor/biotin-[acetyl-CoA-carboxylase] ligase
MSIAKRSQKRTMKMAGLARMVEITWRPRLLGEEKKQLRRTVFNISRIAESGLVARVDYHESIGSTSDRALELGASGEGPLPLLVLAERQTAGRGRGENRWWSDEGALTFSLLMEAESARLPIGDWPKIALVAGLAICRALAQLVPAAELKVKWPNDVYLNGRKVCGILSESVLGSRDRLVVGIGINVNNRDIGPRSKVQSPSLGTLDRGLSATSMIECDGICRDLTDVLLSVLDEFDRQWRAMVESGFATAAIAFRERCFLTGRIVRIEQPGGQIVSGICRGIDDCGRLGIATECGEVAVVSGTVSKWEG